MKIILTDGYYITQDNYNYILMQDYEGIGRKDKRPKTMTRTVGYYSNGIKGFKGCIKRYLEESTLDAEKLAECPVKSFCDHLEQLINAKSDEITKNISERIELDKRSRHDEQ